MHDGRPVAMSPERVRHAGTKRKPLRRCARQFGAPGCRAAYVDGITVVFETTAHSSPTCLSPARPPPDVVDIDNPLIVVEVLSPSTGEADHSLKLEAISRFRA